MDARQNQYMSRSRLSHQLLLCELIQQLDETACVDVIRSIHDGLGLENLRELLLKIVLNLTNTITTDSFITIENTIKTIISTSKGSEDVDKHKIDTNNNKSKNKTNFKNITNNNTTLLKLPIDLICKSSLFLNQQDIFNFEQCCHLFYQIVNHSSYINQSNAFKTFDITPNRLAQMLETRYSIYKYCKATTLILKDFNPDDDDTDSYTQQVEKTWKNVQSMTKNDEWLQILFKSIKCLKVETNGTVLLPKLPLCLMFDPITSNLNRIALELSYAGVIQEDLQYYMWQKNIKHFEKEYTKLKNIFEFEGKKVRVLQCLENRSLHSSFASHLCGIESKHLVLSDVNMDMSYWKVNTSSNLRVLTFVYNCLDPGDGSGFDKDYDHLKIDTLRFINFDLFSETYILQDEKAIESLNLHQSVTKLTLHVEFRYIQSQPEQRKRWEQIICNLLLKKNYFHLQNVNILLKFVSYKHVTNTSLIDWIFGILKSNHKVLKHQFKQLNIGIIRKDDPYVAQQCYMLQWNPKVDDKWLDAYQATCDCNALEDNEKNTQKYSELKNQWS